MPPRAWRTGTAAASGAGSVPQATAPNTVYRASLVRRERIVRGGFDPGSV
jgi:hypothetical protein